MSPARRFMWTADGLQSKRLIMLTKEEIKKRAIEFLKNNKVAAISTATKEGEPQASAVYYVLDEDFTFYFLASADSKKIANLRENKKIAFTVWQEHEPITVQGGGEAELLENDGQDKVIQIFDEKFKVEKPFHWPILQLPIKTGFIGVKFKPNWLVYLNLDMEHPENYKASYSQIIP